MPSSCGRSGNTGLGQWIWYRSITLTPRRCADWRPCSATRDAVGIAGVNLVAMNASSRRPWSARPRIASDAPRAYASAVSNRLMPRSSAVCDDLARGRLAVRLAVAPVGRAELPASHPDRAHMHARVGRACFHVLHENRSFKLVLEDLHGRVARQRVDDFELLGPLARATDRRRRSAPAARASVSGAASGTSSTTAHTRSPRSASGRPITATAATLGCSYTTLSTSTAPMFSPLRMMTSFVRPVTDDVPVGADDAEVAGVEEAVGVERDRGLVGIEVPAEQHRAAHADCAPSTPARRGRAVLAARCAPRTRARARRRCTRAARRCRTGCPS